MTPDMIRQLPAGHALVIRGGYAPVIARLGAAWKDPAYKAARRAGHRRRRAHPAPHPARHAAGAPPLARPDRRLRAVPDIDDEAAGVTATRRRPARLPVELTHDRHDRARRPDRGPAPARRPHAAARRAGRAPGRRGPGDPRTGSPRWPRSSTDLKGTVAGHAEALAAVDGLDRHVAELAAPPPVPAAMRGRGTSRRRRRGGGSPTTRAATRRSPGCGAWVERGVPARLRPPRRRAGGVLGAAPAVPVHPGLAVRAVVRPVPAPGRTQATLAGQAEWHTRLLAAAAEQLARETRALPPRHRPLPRAPAGRGRGHDRAHHAASRRWPTPRTAGRCSPASPAARSPPPGTASWTPPPTRTRSPGGGAATRTPTSRSPPAGPARTSSTSTSTARPGNGFAALNRLIRAGLADGAGAIVATPSGGLHLYFAGSGQRCGKLPRHHLDFRAQGGYVLAPPSQVARQALPGHPAPGQRRAAWTGPRSPASSNPAATPAGRPGHGPARRPEPPRRVGRRSSTKATATTACSGPPAAPPKPATRRARRTGGRRARPPGSPTGRSPRPSRPPAAPPDTGRSSRSAGRECAP